MFDRSSLNRAQYAAMRTLAVILVLALIAVAGGIYSDAVLMSGMATRADPDPASWAVAHARFGLVPKAAREGLASVTGAALQ
jgi:hypothetical protein